MSVTHSLCKWATWKGIRTKQKSVSTFLHTWETAISCAFHKCTQIFFSNLVKLPPHCWFLGSSSGAKLSLENLQPQIEATVDNDGHYSRLRTFLDLKMMSENIPPRHSPVQKKEQYPASISSERGRWPPHAEFPSLPRKSESDLFRNLPPQCLSTVWPMSSSCWRRRRRQSVVAVEGWRRDIMNIRLGQREEMKKQMTDR